MASNAAVGGCRRRRKRWRQPLEQLLQGRSVDVAGGDHEELLPAGQGERREAADAQRLRGFEIDQCLAAHLLALHALAELRLRVTALGRDLREDFFARRIAPIEA